MGEPLVYAIVLAWNEKHHTLESLESVLAMDYPNQRIVVVDNGSIDGTSEDVRARFPNVEIVRVEQNIGIAGGYNLGIHHALAQSAEYILILNNDILVAPDMLTELLRAARQHPDAGLLMPKIYHYYGNQNRIWCAGARWRKFPPGVKMIGTDALDSPAWESVKAVEFAPSCALLIPRQVLEKAGVFDPSYFFYQSDWDFSARVRKGGYSILFIPTAKMWHKVSITTQKSHRPARYWFTMGSGSFAFYLDYASKAVLVGYSIWFILREMVKLKWRRIAPFLAGLVYGWARYLGWID
jgi:GT2 family glycosyltransferase